LGNQGEFRFYEISSFSLFECQRTEELGIFHATRLLFQSTYRILITHLPAWSGNKITAVLTVANAPTGAVALFCFVVFFSFL
jgi:hypothetical protein